MLPRFFPLRLDTFHPHFIPDESETQRGHNILPPTQMRIDIKNFLKQGLLNYSGEDPDKDVVKVSVEDSSKLKATGVGQGPGKVREVDPLPI
jgi:hypothetical protein